MTNKETNPIGFLQEFCQKYSSSVHFPNYMELPSTGQDHCKEFSYKCLFDGFEATGKGILKKQAKSNSALNMISLLENEKYFERYNLSMANNDLVLKSSATVQVQSRNAISALQEYCQKKDKILPTYSESSTGMGRFVTECFVSNLKTYGEGSNKKTSKLRAATKMCQELQIYIDSTENLDEEILSNGKNAISVLQELCAQNNNIPNPVYEIKQSITDKFVAVCRVGSLSGEGTDISKKRAKLIAASKVLDQLMEQRGLKSVKIEFDAKRNQSEIVDMCNKSKSILKDFDLSDEENDYDLVPKSSIQKDINPLIDNIGAVCLEDSRVEIEPVTATEQQNIKPATFKNEVVDSEQDKIKMRDDCTSASHYHKNGSTHRSNTNEDNECLLNVTGRVVISSPLTTASILDDFKDQKVTLMGVIKHKEHLRKSYQLEILKFERKKSTKDGYTQKTPTSECIVKWAHKEEPI